VELPGPQFEALQEAILDAFDIHALQDLVRTKLGKRLGEIVDLQQGLEHTIPELITYYEYDDDIERLVSAVLSVRPHNNLIQTYCQRYLPQLLAPPVGAPSAGPAPARGIAAVTAQREGSPVFGVIARFRPELTEIAAGIELLEGYKTLHDLLHTIDVNLLDIVSLTAMAVHRAGTERWNLLDYTGQLLDLAERADRVSLPLPSRSVESRWIATLRSASEALRMAADPRPADASAAATETGRSATCEPTVATEHGQPEQEIDRLRSILGALPRINGILVERARNLDGPLQQLTRMILEQAAAAIADEEAARSVAGEATILETLHQDLLRLVGEHDLWQSLDTNLRYAGGPNAASLNTLLAVWCDLSKEASDLCRPSSHEHWAQALLAAAKRFDEAPATSDQDGERRAAFTQFRQVARARFREVDRELRRLCGSMAGRLNQPLMALLEKTS
jgi:hypothetical protein